MAPDIQIVDPVEVLRGEVTRRIVAAGIFTADKIQRENRPFPDGLPCCRITVLQGDGYTFDSQKRTSKSVIVEFDIMTPALEGTALAGQLAHRIECEFGLDRGSGLAEGSRDIDLPHLISGSTASVTRFRRGTPSTETERNIFYLPVMISVQMQYGENEGYCNEV